MILLLATLAFAGDVSMSATVANPEGDQALNSYEPARVPWVQVSVPANALPGLRESAMTAFRVVEAAQGLPSSPASLKIECGRATCTATVSPQLSPGNLLARKESP